MERETFNLQIMIPKLLLNHARGQFCSIFKVIWLLNKTTWIVCLDNIHHKTWNVAEVLGLPKDDLIQNKAYISNILESGIQVYIFMSIKASWLPTKNIDVVYSNTLCNFHLRIMAVEILIEWIYTWTSQSLQKCAKEWLAAMKTTITTYTISYTTTS